MTNRLILTILVVIGVCAPAIAQDDAPDEQQVRDLVVAEGGTELLPGSAGYVFIVVGEVKDDTADVLVHWLKPLYDTADDGLVGGTSGHVGQPRMEAGDELMFANGGEHGSVKLVRIEQPETRNGPALVHLQYALKLTAEQQFEMAQRDTVEVPGLDGMVELTIGDITRGQTVTSVKTKDGDVLLDSHSMEEGDEIEFVYGDSRLTLRLVELDNNLIADFATFSVEPVEEDDEAEEPETVRAPPETFRPSAMSLRAGSSVTFGRGDDLATVVVGPVDEDGTMIGVLGADGEWLRKPQSRKAEDTVAFRVGERAYRLRVLQVGASGVEADNVTLQVVAVDE